METSCPTHEELLKFLDETCSKSSRQFIVSHVEACLSCQSTLEQLVEEQSKLSKNLLRATTDSDSFRSLSAMQHQDKESEERQYTVTEFEPLKDLPKETQPEIDGFRLVRELGRGTSGVVYEAIQDELERRVAIKLISKTWFHQSDFRERFVREARSVAALNHPNIARLYQISSGNDGTPFLVLEFVDGNSLEQILATKGVLDNREAAKICLEIADAIHSAHESKLVHRDLKPSNILLTSDHLTAKVIDFGLAINPNLESRLTADAFIAGTPAYMSPEQILTPKKIDRRSDVYSLGVVFYELLTGDVPFRGITKHTLDRIIHEDPRRPTVINPDIAKDLETICLKAISKAPQDRYPSMTEMGDDLRCWLEGRPISARPISNWSRALRWSKRNRLAAGLIGAVATMLVLITVGSLIGMLVLARTNQHALDASERSQEATLAALKQRDALLNTIDTLVYEVNDQAQNEILDQDLLQITLLTTSLNAFDKDDPDLPADDLYRISDIHARLGGKYLDTDQLDEAKSHLEQANEIASRILETDITRGNLNRLLAIVAWERLRYSVLADHHSEVDAIFLKADSLNKRLRSVSENLSMGERQHILTEAYARLGYADFLYEQKNFDDSLKQFRKAISLGEILIRAVTHKADGELSIGEFQCINIQTEAALMLGDHYWEAQNFEEAARFDNMLSRHTERLDLYESEYIVEGGLEGVETSLSLSRMFWQQMLEEIQLNEPSGDSDSTEIECLYYLSLIDIETGDVNSFFKRFQSIIEKFKVDFVVGQLGDDSDLIFIGDAIYKARIMASENVSDDSLDISKLTKHSTEYLQILEKAVEANVLLQRYQNRITYAFKQINN